MHGETAAGRPPARVSSMRHPGQWLLHGPRPGRNAGLRAGAAPARCRCGSRTAPAASHRSIERLHRGRSSLVPDDGHRLPLAVLHHRIARPMLARVAGEGLPEAAGVLSTVDELGAGGRAEWSTTVTPTRSRSRAARAKRTISSRKSSTASGLASTHRQVASAVAAFLALTLQPGPT
jgi:hypothetical protein